MRMPRAVRSSTGSARFGEDDIVNARRDEIGGHRKRSSRPLSRLFGKFAMGKDRRKEKADEDEALGKQADKFGKKGDGKKKADEKDDKSFSHQSVRHILVQKQSEALRISKEIHDGAITFNEAAFKYSEDKAGAYGLLGEKAQHELDPDFWAASLTCKEGDWLREPVKTQWGWHLIMVQHRLTKSAKGGKNAATGKKK